MQLRALGRHGRTATMALAGIVLASGCSAFGEDPLAVVPPGSRAEAARAVDQRERARRPRVRATPTVSPTPAGINAVARSTGTPRGAASPAPAATGVTVPPERRPSRERDLRVVRLDPRPRPGAFRIDLYRPGDFSHQRTKDWCVAGSTQIMMNIMRGGRNDRSAASQERLYQRGRQLSPNKRKLGPIGVDLIGWAELLNTGGYGPYVVDGAGNRRAAIRKAARALRVTGRPVGLVTWRGAHSWVMSGFTATADPAWDAGFEVRGVYIQDTWYPWVSTIWGASRPPGSLVPVAALAEDYLPYRRPLSRWPARDGRFMLILPVLPADTVVR